MDMATPTATTTMAITITDTIMDLVMDMVCRITSNLLQSPLFKKGTKQFIIFYTVVHVHYKLYSIYSNEIKNTIYVYKHLLNSVILLENDNTFSSNLNTVII